MIRAVIFDYGGVVTDTAVTRIQYLRTLQDIARSFHIPLGRVKDAVNKLLPQYQTGALDDEGFWRVFSQETNSSLPLDYRELWMRHFSKIEWNTAVLELHRQLKKSGYKTPVLSNTIPPHARFLREGNHYEGFNPVILSCEVGLMKPDERIYKLVLEEARCIAEECVYIDDRAELLKPAQTLGMHTIHFHNAAQLCMELSPLGVHP